MSTLVLDTDDVEIVSHQDDVEVIVHEDDVEIISVEDGVNVTFSSNPDIRVELFVGIPGARGPEGNKYEMAFALQDRPREDEIWPRYVFSTDVTFPAGAADSFASARVAATGGPVFSCQKNDVEFATITFSGDTGTITQAADAVFEPGDVFTLVAPAVRDDTLADLSITFAGTR